MITKQEFIKYINHDSLTLEICKDWIEGGGDPNIQSPFGWTALMSTSHKGSFYVVQYLVENGVKIDIQDEYGWTALIWASCESHLELVKYLIDSGADITNNGNIGKTALYYQRKNIQGIKIFLQSKQFFNKIKGLKRKNISFNQFINL